MKDTLICTVGTSLLRYLDEAGCKKNAIAASKWLMEIDASDRNCGAEINSNCSIIQQGYLDKKYAIYLLVSDTDDGRYIGDVLRRYYSSEFEISETHTIEGLHNKDFEAFRNQGLRNLVKKMGNLLKERRQKGFEVVINATGGFKAQISFAGLIGQTLMAPVYYMFEGFTKVIEMPPMPVSFDYSLWLRHFELLEAVSHDYVEKSDPLVKQVLESKLLPLLNFEEDLVSISAMGELFHEGFKQRFSRESEEIIPPTSKVKPEDKKIIYEDGNSGKHRGLKDFLEKIREVDYVTRIVTFYYNPNLPERNQFRISIESFHQVEGWYSDGKATTKFWVFHTGESEMEARAVLADLTEKILSK